MTHSLIDAVGFFTRDAKLATTVSRVLSTHNEQPKYCSAHTELLFPKDIFSGNEARYLSHVEPFIAKLESFLQVKRTEIDIGAMFKEQSVAGGTSIEDYLSTVSGLNWSRPSC